MRRGFVLICLLLTACATGRYREGTAIVKTIDGEVVPQLTGVGCKCPIPSYQSQYRLIQQIDSRPYEVTCFCEKDTPAPLRVVVLQTNHVHTRDCRH